MVYSYATAMAWSLGLLFAPENLVLLGNLAGNSGTGIIALLIGAAVLYWLMSGLYGRLLTIWPDRTAEIKVMSTIYGSVPATALALSGRLLLAVCLATAVLVAAGFVFNEVFVYRFPNFAFAFLLLGLILLVHLWRPRSAEIVQMALVVIAVGGLMVLSLAGAMMWLSEPQNRFTPSLVSPIQTIAGAALLLAGFEVLIYARHKAAPDASATARQCIVVVTIAAVALGLWSLASLAAVDAGRLSDTTIPHILAARKIMGQTGRYLMGLIVIAGSAAAVNALFTASARLVVGAGRNLTLSSGPDSRPRQSRLVFTLLALATALSMATGLAGTDKLNTYIRSGLILWLVNYAAICAAFLFWSAQNSSQHRTDPGLLEYSRYAVFFVMVTTAVVALVWTDENTKLMLTTIAATVTAIAILIGLVKGIHHFHRD